MTVRSALACIIALGSAAAPARPAAAQEDGAIDLEARYSKTHVMVPMRDGTGLYTIVYAPRDTTRDYPILLYRTPYSIAPYEDSVYPDRLGPSEEFDREGYIFVFQDVRGKYGSEGDFQVIEPLWTKLPGPQPDSVDESTDTWDTIDWLVQNLPHNNGRVGQWGISYSGWETVMAMADPHPALKAVSPQASPSDMFIGDDWHHNGAFRMMYAFWWLSFNASTVRAGAGARPERFDYGTPWGYRFFLEGGSADRIAHRYFGDATPPAWNGFIAHPDYDEYWQRKNALQYLGHVGSLPVLNVAGWFDAEDFYGPMSIYRTVEEENPDNRSTLVVGPWRHGGWSRGLGDHLGCVDFGSATGEYFRSRVLYPFFRKYLEGDGAGDLAEAVVFESGRNRWRRFASWPPPDADRRRLYFRADGGLSFEPPPDSGPADVSDEYVSDPENPVPFTDEIRNYPGHLWMIGDQRYAATRPDVLVYQTPPLTEPVTVAGRITAHLSAATTGTDADWIVKLIDVYPGDAPASDHCGTPMGDYEMLVAPEIMRGRYRNSYSNPVPMEPGKRMEVEFSLRDRFHTFLPGHRIMVQVHSTWFPAYDRNPQTYVPNIYTAQPEDYRKTTQTIYRSRAHPSYLEFPSRPAGDGS